jgi:hypothetical protein
MRCGSATGREQLLLAHCDFTRNLLQLRGGYLCILLTAAQG